MKLKRFLTIGLALVMAFSLVACGNKTEEAKPVETNPTVATPADVIDVTAEKQAYYENYFAGEDFGFAGESFMAKAEGMEIAIMKAQDKTCLFKMAMGETLFEIYVDNKYLQTLNTTHYKDVEGKKICGFGAASNRRGCKLTNVKILDLKI